jgi:hypothetical protein
MKSRSSFTKPFKVAERMQFLSLLKFDRDTSSFLFFSARIVFFFVFGGKFKFHPKLTSATDFLLTVFFVSSAKLTLGTVFCRDFLARGGLAIEQAKITCLSHGFLL